MPDYTQLQAFETGQVLSRAQLEILRQNDEYFHGLAYRWRTVPNCTCDSPLAGQTSLTAWTGYVYIPADCKMLSYWYDVTGGSASVTSYLTLYASDGSTAVGTGNVAQKAAAAGVTETVSGTVNLETVLGTTITTGLYCLKLRAAKDSNDDTMSLAWRAAPCLLYTGSLSYTSPPTITDGNTSTAGHFNAWRSNDLYFAANQPVQGAFSGCDIDGAAATMTLFDGYIPHFGTRVYYSVTFTLNNAGEKIQIVYDYGGGGQQTILETGTTGTHTSYTDLTSTHTAGTWKRVVVRLLNGGDGTVNYLYVHPQPGDEDEASTPHAYTIMPAFTVNQYVYGSTSGQNTRLQLFSNNDRHILTYLCENVTVGQRIYPVRLPEYVRLGGTDKADLKLVRRYDTLYYRTSGAVLEWGDGQSQSLTDYDSSNGYYSLDLNSLTGLAHGSVYTITGTVHYAAEIPNA